MSLTHAYAPITKADKHDDGTMTVSGKATGPDLDLDEQICDATWLGKAMPQWFESGANVREQHGERAAGVGRKLTDVGGSFDLESLVVDPISVKKVETGVLKGYSIGIRNAKVIKDAAAPGGRIVGGQIVEVSLVDRPANPTCQLMLAKAVKGGDLAPVETLIEKEAPVAEETQDEAITEGLAAIEQEPAPVVAPVVDEEPAPVVVDDVDAADKAVSTSPTVTTITTLLKSATADELAVIYKTLKPKKDKHKGDKSEKTDKAAKADTSKSVLTAEVEKQASAIEALTGELAEVKSRLEKVEAMPVEGGPTLVRAEKDAQAAAELDAKAVQAADFRMKAAAIADPKLREGYLLLAEGLDVA